jgi:hypothetical protein
MRWILRVVGVLVCLAALFVGFCIYRTVSDALHAENVLHAGRLTIKLLDDYVTEHDGRWPSSWTDLEKLPPTDGGMFEWPKDSAEVQRYIAVNFAARTDSLATQSVKEFDAVRPIKGSYYEFRDEGNVGSLLKKIREYNRSSKTKLK